MEMTYDWIMNAYRNDAWRGQIIEAMTASDDRELTWDEMFRLRFDHQNKCVFIRPLSADSDFHWKIFPTRMTYRGLSLLLEQKFDELQKGDISRLDEEF